MANHDGHEPEHSKVEKAPDLIGFVEGKGGFFNQRLRIESSPNGFGTGVVASQNIEKGEVTAIIPLSCGITAERAMQDGDVGQLLRDSRVNGVVVLHLFVAYHKSRGKASRWAPYIEGLPEAPAVPLFYNEDEIALLNPSTSFDKLGWALEELSQEYHTLRTLGLFSGPEMQGIDFATYRWATAICMSRLFYVAGEPVLLPIVDAFNHHAVLGGEFQRDGHNYVLHAVADLATGDEAFVTYGGGGPQAYFFHYGFVDPPRGVLEKMGVRRGSADAGAGPVVPWWLSYMLTPDNDFCDTFIEYNETMHVLMRDCIPTDGSAWDIEVPPEFAADLSLDAVGSVKLFELLTSMGLCDVDVERFSLRYGRDPDKGTVLLDAGSLCALRILCAVDVELKTWQNAVRGSPIGPRSEIAAAAVLTAALRQRIKAYAEAFAALVKHLCLTATPEGVWTFSGPPPPSYPRLCQIGAVLCHETILTQRLLEEAVLVPERYLTVSTQKPKQNIRWK